MLATLALYAAPFAYFMTGCTNEPDSLARSSWAISSIVVIALAYPVWSAIGLVTVSAGVLAGSHTARSCRFRNRAVAAAIGAMIYGAFAPTRCSILG